MLAGCADFLQLSFTGWPQAVWLAVLSIVYRFTHVPHRIRIDLP
jgi:hypothetical protein